MLVGRVVSDKYLVYSRNRSRLAGDTVDAGACDQNVDVPANLLRSRDGNPRLRLKLGVIMFSYN